MLFRLLVCLFVRPFVHRPPPATLHGLCCWPLFAAFISFRGPCCVPRRWLRPLSCASGASPRGRFRVARGSTRDSPVLVLRLAAPRGAACPARAFVAASSRPCNAQNDTTLVFFSLSLSLLSLLLPDHPRLFQLASSRRSAPSPASWCLFPSPVRTLHDSSSLLPLASSVRLGSHLPRRQSCGRGKPGHPNVSSLLGLFSRCVHSPATTSVRIPERGRKGCADCSARSAGNSRRQFTMRKPCGGERRRATNGGARMSAVRDGKGWWQNEHGKEAGKAHA